MPHHTRTFPLDIIADHAVARLRHGRALIDTGSPLTMRPPAIVTEQLGLRVRWLVGTDVLRRNRVLIDWPARRVVVGGPAVGGNAVDLTPSLGLFQIAMTVPQGRAHAWLDTGAPLSYAPAAAVAGLSPVERRRDFHPLLGEFDVDVYRLRVEVSCRQLDCLWGVLPEWLGALLAGVGGTGWILGADFFRDRAIQLDLRRNRLVDATAARATPRVTRATASLVSAAAGEEVSRGVGVGRHTSLSSRRTIRQVTTRLDGWRAWRLAAVADGEPRLMSLVRPDIWHGPVFVSERSPTLAARDSSAGIHAWRTPVKLSPLGSAAIAYGEVTLFGRVYVHEMGFRAERARIDRLFLRACGYHANLPDNGHEAIAGAYCGCGSLQRDEWLSHEQLLQLAAALEDIYQCAVTVDLERARVPASQCPCQRQRMRFPRSR